MNKFKNALIIAQIVLFASCAHPTLVEFDSKKTIEIESGPGFKQDKQDLAIDSLYKGLKKEPGAKEAAEKADFYHTIGAGLVFPTSFVTGIALSFVSLAACAAGILVPQATGIVLMYVASKYGETASNEHNKMLSLEHH